MTGRRLVGIKRLSICVYSIFACGKTCGKVVENLWREAVENLPGEFSTGVFHRFSTGFPQPYICIV